MFDPSIMLPNLSIPEHVLTQVIIVVSGLVGLQWILTATIADSLKKPSFYFFLTAMCFALSAYLIPTDGSSTSVFVESTLTVNAFIIVMSDMLALVGAVLVRIGKFHVYERKIYPLYYIAFIVAFFIIDSTLIITGFHSFNNFMIVYGLFALVICYFLVMDCFYYKSNNIIFKLLDAFPFAMLCVMIVAKILATALGIIDEPVTEYEEQMLWGYLVIQGLLNINLSMHVIQRQLSTIINSSKKDGLTGAVLRNGVIENLTAQVQLAERYHDGVFSVIFMDIDFFKKINDQYGHSAGDITLKHVAAILRDNVRTVDTVGRWGGEEFIIVLPKTNALQAAVVAEKLRHTIESIPVQWKDNILNITASFGVSELHENDTINTFAVDLIVDRADQAMYQAKMSGRNRVVTN